MSVNAGLAHVSTDFMIAALLIYSVALLAFAGDYAFGRPRRKAMMAAAPQLASAQDEPRAVPPKQKKLPEPPAKLPKVGPDRTRGLDFLFGALKAAPDEVSAKAVEAKIWARRFSKA